MKIIPVSLCIFHRKTINQNLEVWLQTRIDDGPYHGLLEFPGGGIEPGESPLEAAVREVDEEVGLKIDSYQGKFFGTYSRLLTDRSILLYVFLFPEVSGLNQKGQWLEITKTDLSSTYQGKIPPLNHQMIDDLFFSLYDSGHE